MTLGSRPKRPEKHLPKASSRALELSRGAVPTTSQTLDLLAALPEEELWLAGQKSERTRKAYREDVHHFIRALGLRGRDDLRKVDRGAVLAWLRVMETQGAKPSTIRRRLSALSSLFTHLVHVRAADQNPVREVRRPNMNRKHGTTAAFSPKEARAILDAPAPETLSGLRDRAILSVGFQVGCRRAEIASMTVGALHVNRGYESLRFVRKGGEVHSLAINPNTAQRIRAYLQETGHREDLEGPLFRPVRPNQKAQNERRFLDPDGIDRILRKYARKAIGSDRGYSAHSMRATFITTALENGANLEDVQEAVGHADPSTTKLYDRRGYNPEKAASFFANY
jgi:site-specific recombinase XerD